MRSCIWKTEAGRARLDDWYERFRSELDFPTESVTVSTRHGSSHVLVGGPRDAPPLVCLHAMRTGASFLLSALGPVLKRFRVYAPDSPGQSVRGLDKRLSLKDNSHAEWLLDVLDALQLDTVNLLGASWGGFLARLTATNAPSRVRRLVLVVPAGIANGSHLTGLTKMAWPMVRYRVRPTTDNLKRLLSPIMTTWDEGWAGVIATSLNDMRLDPRIPPLASDEELRRLTMPTLVLAGDQDIAFPADRIVRRLSAVRPGIEVEILHGCKHGLPTTAEFQEWLRGRLEQFFLAENVAAALDD